MISEKMVDLVKNSSVIRSMFEEGKRLAGIYGAENVYDFSLGNPSVEPPVEIKEALLQVLNEESPSMVHGYMNNSGYEDVREKVSENLNKRFETDFNKDNIIMTVGAAGGLNVILKTLLNPNEEVLTFAPFFGEYRNYVSNFDGKLTVVPPNTVDFQPNLDEFEQLISKKTKAVIINSPNNPTGVVYSEQTILKLAEILNKKQKEFGISIYLISDEPYRELAYDGIDVPYLTKYYRNTIVGYSFSKSLSLPGERIGYLVIPNEVDDYENVIGAANVANRILGYVNAPSLIQRAVAKCLDSSVDLEIYNRNRELIYNSLISYGYQCVKPQGAFYLFVKALEEDEKAFAQAAKKHNILIVPGSSFGCPGYCRIAYCVDYSMIERALPGFKKLAQEYGIMK
ncbi:pyridoxal phosphate-dependent aminotransferase [Mobilitalea sibirica]|uniref:Aminotransferase n=1 Tax=Mobilitalea sibirica TaxID=1462919 RepID=A0A8J7HCZ8_9FIRM|nr:pyridoxal phosphate-dependent aminotransferase [Mobilitalea sibirica]MBH1940354.1 pyridoxal phosphate-dependent aminotransferase [Mobilitalea sibirica]